MPAISGSDREIVMERWFDAPRELVWSAWTDPKHLDQWWGPNGFRNETHAMDFRVGGLWHYTMHGPDGKAWPNWIRYHRIQKPERLEYDHGGELNEPAHFKVVVTFVELAGRTQLTMRTTFPTAEACAAVKKFGALEGGQQTLARLAGFLPHLADGSAARSMVLTRLFDAPAREVFQAWSTHYLGGAPALSSVTFTEENGKTRLTVLHEMPRDAAAAKGQVEGWNESLGQLAAKLRG